MNKFTKDIEKHELCYQFASSLNGILGLTNKELLVFSIFLSIYMDSQKVKSGKKSIDSTDIRKVVMETCGVSKENLSRYIGLYKSRGLFYTNMYGKTQIMRVLIPDIISGKTVQTVILLKIKQNDK